MVKSYEFSEERKKGNNSKDSEKNLENEVAADSKGFFAEELDDVYAERLREDNGIVQVRILDSPYSVLNFHTTGERAGKARVIPLRKEWLSKLFAGDEDKSLMKGSCRKIISYIDKVKPSLADMIRTSYNPEHQYKYDLEYMADEE